VADLTPRTPAERFAEKLRLRLQGLPEEQADRIVELRVENGTTAGYVSRPPEQIRLDGPDRATPGTRAERG
jgi:hypothetical protein